MQRRELEHLIRAAAANTDLKIGWCLEPHDLAASKLAAGRDKDWPFVETMLKHQLIEGPELVDRLATLPIPSERIGNLVAWVQARG